MLLSWVCSLVKWIVKEWNTMLCICRKKKLMQIIRELRGNVVKETREKLTLSPPVLSHMQIVHNYGLKL